MSSAALRAGIRMGETAPRLLRETLFSASRNESVAAAVRTPASPNKYTLWSSGFIVEVEAHPTTLRNKRTKSPDLIVKDFSAETRGRVGKSSLGMLFIDAFEVGVSSLSTSPL